MTYAEQKLEIQREQLRKLEELEREYLKYAKYQVGQVVLYKHKLNLGLSSYWENEYILSVGVISAISINSRDDLEYNIHALCVREDEDNVLFAHPSTTLCVAEKDIAEVLLENMCEYNKLKTLIENGKRSIY